MLLTPVMGGHKWKPLSFVLKKYVGPETGVPYGFCYDFSAAELPP
jgi:hypothetical protein